MRSNIKLKNVNRLYLVCLSSLFSIFSHTAMAANDWGNYRGVERQKSQPSKHHQSNAYGYSSYKGYANPYGTPLPPQQYPIRPPVNQRPYPPNRYPHPAPYPVYPQQNGLTIIYNQQLPPYIEYNSQHYGFVNGVDGRIESSTYTLISDWRRYGLPPPNIGMHWIYQNGRYIQIKNDR